MSRQATVAVVLCLLVAAQAAPAPAPGPASSYVRPLNSDCAASTVSTSSINYFPSPFHITGVNSTSNGRVTVNVAKDFSVQYFDTYKIVTNSLVNETYVLYQCGTPAPASNSLPVGAKVFAIPLTSVAALDTTPVAFLAALNVMDRVRMVSSLSTNSCAQKLVACNKTAPAAFPVTANVLQSSVAPFTDAAITSSAYTNAPSSLAFSAASDPGPLNRVEWIKFLGVFFNMDAVATKLFDDQVSGYNQTRDNAPKRSTPPVMAFVDLYTYPPDSAYEVSLAPYKVQYTQDSGAVAPNKTALLAINGTSLATYDTTNNTVWFAWNRTTGGFPSKAAATAAFQNFLKGVDIVVDETFAVDPTAYNFSTFLTNYNLSANSSGYKFLTNKTVYREDKLLSATLGLDWFEGALANPNKVLQDFVAAVNSNQTYNSTWIRNIARGENVTIVGADSCNAIAGCAASPTPICPYAKACSDGASVTQKSLYVTCAYDTCSS